MSESNDVRKAPASSRRDMLKTPVTAAALAAAVGSGTSLLAATVSTVPSIQIPKEIPANLAKRASRHSKAKA